MIEAISEWVSLDAVLRVVGFVVLIWAAIAILYTVRTAIADRIDSMKREIRTDLAAMPYRFSATQALQRAHELAALVPQWAVAYLDEHVPPLNDAEKQDDLNRRDHLESFRGRTLFRHEEIQIAASEGKFPYLGEIRGIVGLYGTSEASHAVDALGDSFDEFFEFVVEKEAANITHDPADGLWIVRYREITNPARRQLASASYRVQSAIMRDMAALASGKPVPLES